eukprot:1968160-Amphidinium_carterae.1
MCMLSLAHHADIEIEPASQPESEEDGYDDSINPGAIRRPPNTDVGQNCHCGEPDSMDAQS